MSGALFSAKIKKTETIPAIAEPITFDIITVFIFENKTFPSLLLKSKQIQHFSACMYTHTHKAHVLIQRLGTEIRYAGGEHDTALAVFFSEIHHMRNEPAPQMPTFKFFPNGYSQPWQHSVRVPDEHVPHHPALIFCQAEFGVFRSAAKEAHGSIAVEVSPVEKRPGLIAHLIEKFPDKLFIGGYEIAYNNILC
jgi:hypothetical protein